MDASLRSAQRLLGTWIPYARTADGPGPTLETLPVSPESPRLVAAPSVEGGRIEARRVPGDPVAAFGGFLDGIQASRVAGHWEGVPIVHGTVGAVIRARRDRRLVTHGTGPLVERCLCVPRWLVPPALWDAVQDAAIGHALKILDTGDAPESEGVGEDSTADSESHPFALAERAVHVVRTQRERLERRLAEQWSRTEESPLYLDGSITGSERVATAKSVIGVIKGHRTLYVGADGLPLIAKLEVGERTTVVRLSPARRTPVLSWYLRLRDATGRAPTWGLVRVEVAELSERHITARADEISRWVLAERAPVSLPDWRWDTMAYGIRDCEEFLRAII
jgi:hypothetical protein